MKKACVLLLILMTMKANSQEIQDIFVEKKVSLNISSKDQESNFPLVFFGEKVKNSSIGATEDKITSISFTINGKDNLKLL